MALVALGVFGFRKIQEAAGKSSYDDYLVFTASSYAAGIALFWAVLMFAMRKSLSRGFVLALTLNAVACWGFWTLRGMLPNTDHLLNGVCTWVAILIVCGAFVAFAIEVDRARNRRGVSNSNRTE
jgi:predicted membrane-bound spermidine synthase